MRTVGLYVVGLFLALASAAWASDNEGNHGNASRRSAGARPELKPGKLPQAIRDATADAFLLSKDYVEKRYQEILPAALKDVFERDAESDIAETLAQLFGTLDDKQVDDLVALITKLRDKVPDQPENEVTKAYLDRLLWGAKIIRAEANAEAKAISKPGEDFEKEFRYHFARVQKASSDFYSTLEKAKSGDEEAKALLRDEDNYNPDVMSRFLGGKVASGNRSLSTDLAEALAERNATGEHFVDLKSKIDGKPARLYLGDRPEQFFDSLSQFNRDDLPDSSRSGGFNAFRTAARRHSDEEMSQGQVFRPAASKATGNPKPIAQQKPRSPARPTKAELDSRLTAFVDEQGCVGCHSSGKQKFFDDSGNWLDSGSLSSERLLEVLAGKDLKPGGTMEGVIADVELNEEVKTMLKQWGQAQGVPDANNAFLGN